MARFYVTPARGAVGTAAPGTPGCPGLSRLLRSDTSRAAPRTVSARLTSRSRTRRTRRGAWQPRCTPEPGASAPQGGPRSMAKVMVVDDAYSELKLMESILRSAGHEVVSLIDGEALEDKLSTERPDVLLLDIVMPKRNGYEILRALRKDARTKTTPVVLVSSKNQESDKVWGKRQGADEYLAKPFTSDQLLTVVKRFAR